jgi:hypothetical protein
MLRTGVIVYYVSGHPVVGSRFLGPLAKSTDRRKVLKERLALNASIEKGFRVATSC